MPVIAPTAILLTAAAALTLPAAAHAAAPADSPHPVPRAGETVTQPLQAALKSLTVKDEDRTGYQRTSFKHWVDADQDGCTTRII
ncbi:hypothetical protein [Streptomyces sp. NPDC048436]|uniref:hypothetical protein n=1 Tax=Streptomyces sp. NPDC048436 TaxID=3365550 RepID=UPI00371E253A